MKEITEEQLWKKLKSGNEKAFRQLYDRYVDQLISYGYKFTADRQVLEDCCQELFVTLWKKRSKLPDLNAPGKYLYRAMRNNLIKQLQRGENKYVSGVDDHIFDWTPAIDQSIMEEELDRENVLKLKAAIKELPERQKEAIYLKYQKGLEYEEICEIMDINYQSVRNLVSRGLTTLREILTIIGLFLINIVGW